MTHDEEVLGKAYDARLMRRLLTYLYPYRGRVALAAAAIVGHSILELAPPYLTKLVIDRYIPSGDLSGLGFVAMVFLLTLTGSFALEYLQTWTLQMLGQRIMFDLRMQVIGHLQRLDLSFYDRNPVGRLMTRVTTDVDVLNELFTSGVVSVFGDLFTLVGIMGVLIWMDWRLALVAFSVLPLIVVITQWFRRNVRESYRTVRTWIARINAYLQERITGMTTVHLFRREARDFCGLRRDRPAASRRERAVDLLLCGVLSGHRAGQRARGGADPLGRRRWVISNTLTLGSLVAFLMYAQRFFRPIRDMSEKFNVLQGAMASSERIFGLLDTPVDIATSEPAQAGPHGGLGAAASVVGTASSWSRLEPAGRRDRVRARDLRLRREASRCSRTSRFASSRDSAWPSSAPPARARRRLSACCCGSTTCRSGRITIDGVDIRDMDLAALRSMFGLVLQDVHLFSGTIAGNIRLGNDAISDEAVRRAAAPCMPTCSSIGCRRGSPRRWRSAAPPCRSGRNSCCRSRARSRSIRAS